MLDLDTPLEALPSVGPKFWQRFKRLGLQTVGDLLYNFPSRYEDYSEIYRISDLEPGQQATVQGIIESVELRRTWKRHMTVVEAVIRDDSGSIRAVWFNQPYLKNTLRAGRRANFSGKVSASDEDLYLSHPTHEMLGPQTQASSRPENSIHTGRLVPVYPETRGLTSKGVRFVVQPVLRNLRPLTDWLPENVREEFSLPEINRALHNVHFPANLEEAEVAKKRFAFEDLFLLQIFNLQQKLRLAKEKSPTLPISPEGLAGLVKKLPFSLTFSQKRSVWEIARDMANPRPMNRLLQGDVGSGKTAVAALAAMIAAKNKYQTAVMAPTEVLAKQHFLTFRKLLRGLPAKEQPALALLTSQNAKVLYSDDLEAEMKKPELLKQISKNKIQIIIGTHALIQKSVSFSKIGLVVIDEQHRFGIDQRAKLSNNKHGGVLPHFLSMSATPIPRTLMLTVFGDLDISTIDELPSGRKPILTKIVSPENRIKAYGFIKGQIKKGRQAFVICPRIDPPEQNPDKKPNPRQAKLWEVRSVKEEFEKLSQKIFPEFKVAMLHGQMPGKSKAGAAGKISKEAVMQDFAEGKTDVLVSTSVIEVGVDVPNTTIMMIEGAERFGLAQLYQFRGRVGRGEHQSFCLLFTDSGSRAATERLKAIVGAKNGFELAERDLEMRGPGEFIGQKQTGLPDIAMRGLQNSNLIRESREAAVRTVQKDPLLASLPALQAKLKEFQAKIHLE